MRSGSGIQKHIVIKIDLSRARDRKILGIFAAGAVVLLFVTALGSYQTYQYTESVEFCGKKCHLPMEPEFVASQHTAHASVECVACHVGPGAAAYFKTKINGVKQLYHTVRNDFDRPIRVSPPPIRAQPRQFASNAIGQRNMSAMWNALTNTISQMRRTHRSLSASY